MLRNRLVASPYTKVSQKGRVPNSTACFLITRGGKNRSALQIKQGKILQTAEPSVRGHRVLVLSRRGNRSGAGRGRAAAVPRGAAGRGALSGGPLRLGEGQAAQQCPLPRLSLAPPAGCRPSPAERPAQHGTKRRSRRRCLIPSAEHRSGQERKGGWGGGASAWPAVRAGGGGERGGAPGTVCPAPL